MKPYGKPKRLTANRKIKGNQRKPCPCCVPRGGIYKTKGLKKRARQEGQRKIRRDSCDD